MNISHLIPQCIDTSGLFEDLKLQESPGAGVSFVPQMASAIITHILLGGCFRRRNLPSPGFFTDYIFQSLNRTSNLQIIGKFKMTRQVLCPIVKDAFSLNVKDNVPML